MEINAKGAPPVFAKLTEAERRHEEAVDNGEVMLCRQECLDTARDLAEKIMSAAEEWSNENGGEIPPMPPYGLLRQMAKAGLADETTKHDRRLIATYAAIIMGVTLP
jgi:hypothetical protein